MPSPGLELKGILFGTPPEFDIVNTGFCVIDYTIQRAYIESSERRAKEWAEILRKQNGHTVRIAVYKFID